MNWIYGKIMSWLVGEALANSDRIKIAVFGIVSTALVQIAAACPACGSFLTPDVKSWICNAIAGAVVTLILAITHRDIAAPGQTVPGAAVDAPLPPPPVTADGVPGVPPALPI